MQSILPAAKTNGLALQQDEKNRFPFVLKNHRSRGTKRSEAAGPDRLSCRPEAICIIPEGRPNYQRYFLCAPSAALRQAPHVCRTPSGRGGRSGLLRGQPWNAARSGSNFRGAILVPRAGSFAIAAIIRAAAAYVIIARRLPASFPETLLRPQCTRRASSFRLRNSSSISGWNTGSR